MTQRKINKAAFSFSLVLLILWALLGTTSTITWFHEEDALVNALHFGDIDIDLYYKDTNGRYVDIDQSTEVFEDGILYEPGFTHLTYLKIVNAGDIPFTYDLSIINDPESTIVATSVLGNQIDLADYIKFGLIIGDTIEDVMSQTKDRGYCKSVAVNKLNNYSQDGGTLQPGEEDYAALILYMPEEVDNHANYRDDHAPEIGLGIAAIAKQLGYEGE